MPLVTETFLLLMLLAHLQEASTRWDWAQLRSDIAAHGVRNSLLVAPMPTASTSQILGNNECFEPYTSNIYVRRVLSGEFTVVNQHLLADLTQLGLWNPLLKNELVAANGSVQVRSASLSSKNWLAVAFSGLQVAVAACRL